MQVLWKPYQSLNALGNPFQDNAAHLNSCPEAFFEQIVSMPRGIPVSLEVAQVLLGREISRVVLHAEQPDVQRMDWLFKHWVQYLSDMGYQIKLRGDEYLVLS